MLVEDTVTVNIALINTKRGDLSADQVSKVYTHLLLSSKVRQAVQFATSRDKGGILNATDIDSKSGKPVLEDLQSKHPDSIIPAPDHLETYDKLPALVTLDIINNTVQSVAAKMSGGAGPGGIDSLTLQNWLLHFGKESNQLREAIASITRWLADDSPPWVAYQALMANCLVALDKCPGVRPVGIGKV